MNCSQYAQPKQDRITDSKKREKELENKCVIYNSNNVKCRLETRVVRCARCSAFLFGYLLNSASVPTFMLSVASRRRKVLYKILYDYQHVI